MPKLDGKNYSYTKAGKEQHKKEERKTEGKTMKTLNLINLLSKRS